MIVLGVDPGTTTGLAVWDAKAQRFMRITSGRILDIIEEVRQLWRSITGSGDAVIVVVEDARQRFVFSKMDAEQAKYGAAVREGAGSIKRDSAIWEEFLSATGIPYDMRRPSGTKKSAEQFQKLTGYEGRTNEHERDAASAVFGLNEPMARGKLLAFQDGATRVPAAAKRANRAYGARAFVRRRRGSA